jgi:hypothetical protein
MKQKAKEAISQAKSNGLKPKLFMPAEDDDWIEWRKWNRQHVYAIQFTDGSRWTAAQGWTHRSGVPI